MLVPPPFQRLSLITGAQAISALRKTRVILFGAGGVGSWCAEALARSGVGTITLADSDAVCITNINRQVQAAHSTLGQPKAGALKTRLEDINPAGVFSAFPQAFSRETAQSFGIEGFAYVIDAIDTLTHKLDLIEYACRAGKTLFSSMGMAQKLDPTRLKTAGIWETQGCPLARLVRSGLRRRGFAGNFITVYSTERLPLRRESGAALACGSGRCLCPGHEKENKEDKEKKENKEWCASKKVINGSAVPVTAAAGMILASLVIRDICAAAGPGGHGGNGL
ncbi:MAG: tRNA threonylcarbamoyladenosine dehydratase [Spirochaetaceae bacterium]|jgi:tRNA A37 threonylcarbamoyladenosine dehydratase|nr:tRNA threonylcarbamoyladenosine dehydratase [Spirochaetaceae bacterium]